MTKSRFNLRKVVAGVACFVGVAMFSGCDNKGDDPINDDAITVSDNSSLTQEVFADNISGKSLTSFTTTGAWTSSISTVAPKSAKSAQLRASSTDENQWLSITPDHGDKAGTYNIEIILEPNITGEDRTSEITITCKGENIKITVTQKGVKADGKPLSIKDLLCAHAWRHQITITQYPKSWDNPETPEDESIREDKSTYIVTFKTDGTATQGGGSIPYTLSGNTLTLNIKGEDGNIYPMVYQIIGITDNHLDLKGTMQGESQECVALPGGGQECFPPTTYTYTQTMTFIKN